MRKLVGGLPCALLFVLLAAAPVRAAITSSMPVGPNSVRIVVHGSDVTPILRFHAGDTVEVVSTMYPSIDAALSGVQPSMSLSEGCYFIPHPFTPFQGCLPSGIPFADLGQGKGNRVILDPIVPDTLSFEAVATGDLRVQIDNVGQFGYAELIVTLNAPSPPLLTQAEKRAASQVASWLAWATVGLGTLAATCGAMPEPIYTKICRGAALATSAAFGVAITGLSGVAKDPADPNFRAIVHPPSTWLPPPEGIGARLAWAFNQVMGTATTIADLGRAIVATADRLAGAVEAGDEQWADVHRLYGDSYWSLLQSYAGWQPEHLAELRRELEAAGVGVAIGPDAMAQYAFEVAIQGLPQDLTALLSTLGLTAAQIENLRVLVALRPPGVATTLAGLFTRPELLDAFRVLATAR